MWYRLSSSNALCISSYKFQPSTLSLLESLASSYIAPTSLGWRAIKRDWNSQTQSIQGNRSEKASFGHRLGCLFTNPFQYFIAFVIFRSRSHHLFPSRCEVMAGDTSRLYPGQRQLARSFQHKSSHHATGWVVLRSLIVREETLVGPGGWFKASLAKRVICM